MTLSYTPRFHLAVPDFLSEPWHAEFAAAMESIDQALFTAIVAQGASLWVNSHTYAIGDIVIDPTTGTLYTASVVHTSSASPQTFAQEIVAFPGRWTSFAVTAATQPEAEAGTDNAKYMTPLRTAQAITARSPTLGIATQLQAEIGVDNNVIMTPLRSAQQVTARIASQAQAEAGTSNDVLMTPLRVEQQIIATGVAGGAFVGFSAHKNGVNQTGIANGVATKITFGTELYDLGSHYDTANSRWTPPAGMVHVSVGLYATGASVGTPVIVHIYKNGVAFKSTFDQAVAPGEVGAELSIDDTANGTDYYEAFVVLSTGATGGIIGTTPYGFFMGHFLGEVGTVTLGLAEVGFSAHKNGTNQTGIATAVPTKITFGTELYDQGSYFDTANSRWIPPVGVFHISASVQFANSGIDYDTTLSIYKNGVIFKSRRAYGVTVSGNAVGVAIDIDDVASGTDYYEVFLVHSNTAPGTVSGPAANTYFTGHRITGLKGDAGPVGPIGPSGTVTGAFGRPQGRLTLQTQTPVMTTTQSGKSVIYYTPYDGDQVPIFDGVSVWSMMSIGTELSVATTDTLKNPSAIGVNKVNDWFVWNDTGTLRLSHGPDWADDVTRSVTLTKTRGIWLNTSAITSGPAALKGTYVGTTRSDASSLLNWTYPAFGNPASAGAFHVWNMYNRMMVKSFHGNNGPGAYYGGPPRPYLNDTGIRVSFVSGQLEDVFEARGLGCVSLPGGDVYATATMGYDSTTVFSGINAFAYAQVDGAVMPITSEYGATALGVHFFQLLQQSSSSLNFFYGLNVSIVTTQTGMAFEGRM